MFPALSVRLHLISISHGVTTLQEKSKTQSHNLGSSNISCVPHNYPRICAFFYTYSGHNKLMVRQDIRKIPYQSSSAGVRLAAAYGLVVVA